GWPLASTVAMSDDAAAPQLVQGFSPSDGATARWTQPEFALKLAVPPTAAERGGILRLGFSRSPEQVARHAEVRLTVKVNAFTAERTFSDQAATFEVGLPSAELSTEAIVARFTVDHGGDPSTLGVRAERAELVAK